MEYTTAIRRLYQLPEDQRYAFPEEELSALQARVGSPLPKGLMDYYRSLATQETLNSAHNRLLDPEDVFISDDGYLVFYEENQAVVYWGIKITDLVLDYPPVWGNYGTEEQPDWVQESRSLSGFWLLMAVYNGTMGALYYNANAFAPIDQAILAQVQQHWTEVTAISWDRQRVYSDNFDEVISLSLDEAGACTAVFIGTANQQRFDSLLDKLPVYWHYTSYEDMDDEDDDDDEE